MRRYFTSTGAMIYTSTSDWHARYGTRVIPTTVREATYVLDAIFDNETDLDINIEEHTTDTARLHRLGVRPVRSRVLVTFASPAANQQSIRRSEH